MTDLLRVCTRAANRLEKLDYPAPVTTVYNPLRYAKDLFAAYLELAGTHKRKVVFLGMNPGPWGMAQTGVPFGEVSIVRDWLQLSGRVKKPKNEHPKRPVKGLACTRAEVSGARLWGAIKERHRAPVDFFKDNFIANWCPLLFLEDSGRNFAPDKFNVATRKAIADECDGVLATIIDTFEPQVVVGVGVFARKVAERAAQKCEHKPHFATVLHPSPASPKANRGWAKQARAELAAEGIDAL